jgi:hypothetical protein
VQQVSEAHTLQRLRRPAIAIDRNARGVHVAGIAKQHHRERFADLVDAGNVDIDDLGPQSAERFRSGFERGSNLGVQVFVVVVRRSPYADTSDPVVKCREEVQHVPLFAGGVVMVVAGNDIEEPGNVFDAPRHRADDVVGCTHGKASLVGDATGCGPQTTDTRQRCGNADRCCGVGAQGHFRHSSSDGYRRPAARAARYSTGVPGIAALARHRVGRSDAEGELMEVRFPDDDRARPSKSFDREGISGRHVVAKEPRSVGGSQCCRVDVVLDHHRDAVQQTTRAPLGRCPVDSFRSRHGAFLVDRDHGVDVAVPKRHRIQAAFKALYGSRWLHVSPSRRG